MFFRSKDKPFFCLSQKEEDIMKVLWINDEPLTGAEIADKIPERTWKAASVLSILNRLEKKQAIKVTEEKKKVGKVYGRTFKAALTSNEYAVMQFRRYYQPDCNDSSLLLSALFKER